jgi:uncharacterized protein YkwD
MRLRLTIFFVCSLAQICRADVVAEVLDEINFARAHPQSYAHFLAGRAAESRNRGTQRATAEAISFLKNVTPLQPLAFSKAVARGAQEHVLDQGARGTTGHFGSNGSNPWDRMAAHGWRVGMAGENIAYGLNDPKSIVAVLIVDEGVVGRGHRKNIFNRQFKIAGVAFGRHARFGAMCVIDFAEGFVESR